jgi:hypothetical protein
MGSNWAIIQVLEGYQNHDDLPPRRIEIKVPSRRGNDSTRKHGQTDNSSWNNGLKQTVAGRRTAGKGASCEAWQ